MSVRLSICRCASRRLVAQEKLVDTVLSLYVALLQQRGCSTAADQFLSRIEHLKVTRDAIRQS
eukprot:6213390-Pleurochrysis_carterae.AAC.4